MLCRCRADVEDLNSQTEAELPCQVEDRQQETEHVYELLENKIQLLQEVSGVHRVTKTRASGTLKPPLGYPIYSGPSALLCFSSLSDVPVSQSSCPGWDFPTLSFPAFFRNPGSQRMKPHGWRLCWRQRRGVIWSSQRGGRMLPRTGKMHQETR